MALRDASSYFRYRKSYASGSSPRRYAGLVAQVNEQLLGWPDAPPGLGQIRRSCCPGGQFRRALSLIPATLSGRRPTSPRPWPMSDFAAFQLGIVIDPVNARGRRPDPEVPEGHHGPVVLYSHVYSHRVDTSGYERGRVGPECYVNRDAERAFCDLENRLGRKFYVGSNPTPSAFCWELGRFSWIESPSSRSRTATVQPRTRDKAGRVGTNRRTRGR